MAWGSDGSDRCKVPSPNKDFVAIAGGFFHSLGLKKDGTLVVWGDLSHVPSPNSGFLAIAAGLHHNLAIRRVCPCALGGDRNDDCSVNFSDIALMGACWRTDSYFSDLAVMASNWLIDCHLTPDDPLCAPQPD